MYFLLGIHFEIHKVILFGQKIKNNIHNILKILDENHVGVHEESNTKKFAKVLGT